VASNEKLTQRHTNLADQAGEGAVVGWAEMMSVSRGITVIIHTLL
jgi:hypothetical protein